MSTEKRNRPAGKGAESETTAAVDTTQSSRGHRQLRVRRAASWRRPILDHSGRSDPWHYPAPTAGYPDAAHHLLGCGLTPFPDRAGLRLMWRLGGHHRAAAELIAQRWEPAG
jgi:hypothetical protein